MLKIDLPYNSIEMYETIDRAKDSAGVPWEFIKYILSPVQFSVWSCRVAREASLG